MALANGTLGSRILILHIKEQICLNVASLYVDTDDSEINKK